MCLWPGAFVITGKKFYKYLHVLYFNCFSCSSLLVNVKCLVITFQLYIFHKICVVLFICVNHTPVWVCVIHRSSVITYPSTEHYSFAIQNLDLLIISLLCWHWDKNMGGEGGMQVKNFTGFVGHGGNLVAKFESMLGCVQRLQTCWYACGSVQGIPPTPDIFSLADATWKHPKYPWFCILLLDIGVNIDIHKHENSEVLCSNCNKSPKEMSGNSILQIYGKHVNRFDLTKCTG